MISYKVWVKLGVLVILFVSMIACLTCNTSAQGGSGFAQFFIPAGSNSTGYPIVTATVPAGSTSYHGKSGVYDAEGNLTFVASIVYILPQGGGTLETHLFIAGRCSGLEVPTGYRRVKRLKNMWGLSDPDLGGGTDESIEYCLLEIVPR